MAKGFLILITFFTRLPAIIKIDYDEENLKKSLSLFSLVGAVIGFLLTIVYIMFSNTHLLFTKGLFLTISYIAITGAIHLDGLADSCDGFFSGREKQKIFDIMSDPHIGAFGTIGLIIVIAAQLIFFTYSSIQSIFMMPIVGKACTIISCYNKDYAKAQKGMGTIFVESIDRKVVIVNLLILLFFSVLTGNLVIILSSAFATLMIALFISYWIENKIGGMTGDTCGFITEAAQIVFLSLVLLLEGRL